MTKMAPCIQLLAVTLHLMVLPVLGTFSSFQCPQAWWIFGDSLSDTGNTQAAFPFNPLVVLNYPYGESYTFVDKPGHNRYSDGRLVVDFIAQSFNYPFFGTYSHVLNGENYFRGANFAYAGATAEPNTTLTPFYLQLQTNQFKLFKDVALNPFPYFRGPLNPVWNAFSAGAYIIPEIGGNDISIAAFAGQPPAQIIANIVPQILAAVRQAVVTLHDSGARLIILFNIPPQGCSAAFLTVFQNFSPKDALGCLSAYNAIDQAYNTQLSTMVTALQQTYSSDGTQIYLFDYYSATIEISTNPSTYGFVDTLQACCGFGGQYNWNPFVSCGNNGTIPPTGTFVNINTACATPQNFVQWDGIHFTQAFYRQIAKFFLTGSFVSPPLNLAESCNLNFLQWN